MVLVEYFTKLFTRKSGQTVTKVCILCLIEKNISQFPKHKNNKDRHDTRCRACKNITNSHVRRLRKTAPTKPETCECCGKIPK
jgi:hypothetical protein